MVLTDPLHHILDFSVLIIGAALSLLATGYKNI